MNITEIYEKLGDINENKIKKYLKKIKSEKSSTDTIILGKQKLEVAIKKYDNLYLELKNNRMMIMKDYEYLDLLKEKIKLSKEKLINIKYEILYDLFVNSEETKERYTKAEEHLNYLNNLYIEMLKSIKDNESLNHKKIHDIMYDIQKKIDEYKYTSLDDIETRKDIYSKYNELNNKLLEEKRIYFNLFDNESNLRFDIDYRPYKEYNIKNIKKPSYIQSQVETPEENLDGEEIETQVDDILDEE